MALTKAQKVTITVSIISAMAVIIAALVSSQRGVEQDGERNVVINQARDVQIDQSVRTSPPEAELTGLLMPANEPDPPYRCKKPIPSDAIKVFMGSNVTWTDRRDDLRILRLGSQDIVTLNIKPQGVYLSAIIYREDGREVARVINNRFSINPNNYFNILRPDRHEISILDKNGQRVLFLRFINEKTFYFEGIFQVPGRIPLIVTSDKSYIGGLTFSNDCLGNIRGIMFSFNVPNKKVQ